MRKFQLLVCALLILAVCGAATAQDTDIPLSIIKFDSEADYQRYADWMADLKNIRFALIASGKTWSDQVEAWAREFVQKPAKVESNDGIFLVTYADGGIEAEAGEALLYTVVNAYGEWLQRRQSEANDQDKEQLARELAELEERAASSGIVADIETLQSELSDVNARLLEARLEVAQSEARARTVMEHVESKRVVEPPELKKAEDAQRALLETKRAEGEKQFARAKELHERGLNTEAEIRHAELQLMQADADIAELKAKSVQRASHAADSDLRRLLIDAESARASALALEKVLSEQENKLREMIARTLEHKRRIEELEWRLGRNRPVQVRGNAIVRNPGRPDIIRPDAREELNRQRR